MLEINQITDRETLKAWLEAQQGEDVKAFAVAIASRAALRVLPKSCDRVLNSDLARKGDLTPLPFLRCNLIASVAHSMPTDAIKTAAATATFAAAADREQMWSAVRADCQALADNAVPDVWPLWPDGSDPLAQDWQKIKAQLQADGAHWQFWIDWYQQMLKGAPQNWKMLEQIAGIGEGYPINEADWQAGPEVISGKIAEVVKRYKPVKTKEPVTPDNSKSPPQASSAVGHLLVHRIVTQMAADGLAQHVNLVIEQYHKDTGKNQLPDAFQALNDLPPILQQIAMQVCKADKDDQKHSELAAEVERLKEKITQLEKDLQTAGANGVKGRFSEVFLDQAAKSLGDWKMWGALLTFAGYATGQSAVVELVDSIGKSIIDIFPNTAPPINPVIPPSPAINI